jgi:hypothetical protein
MTRPIAALVFAVVAVGLEGAGPVAQAPGGPRFVGEAGRPRTGRRCRVQPMPSPLPNGSGPCRSATVASGR